MKQYLSLFGRFCSLGFLAWGGPKEQLAMIHQQCVEKGQWLSDEQFHDTLAAYKELPGPQVPELCVSIGRERAGIVGGVLAGLGFILPGLLLVLGVAWMYQSIGAAVMVAALIGIKPAVAAMMVRASEHITRATVNNVGLGLAALLSMILTLCDAHFVPVLMITVLWNVLWNSGLKRSAVLLTVLACMILSYFGFPESPSPYEKIHHLDNDVTVHESSVPNLFSEGITAGVLSFGGAYSAVPFIQETVTYHYGNVTPDTVVDAMALTLLLPAPLMAFVTFLGFTTGGWLGALAITIGAFIPVFVVGLVPLKKWQGILANNAYRYVLDGIAGGVVGIFLVATFRVMAVALTGWITLLLGVAALWVLYRYKTWWSAPAVILASGILGYLYSLL